MTAADILEALFRINLAAGAAILGVIALRKLVRIRFGARLAYDLWLLPVLTSAAVLIPARQVHIVRSAAPALARTLGVHESIVAPPAPTAAVISLDPLVLVVALWIAGIAVTALIMAVLQLRFMRRARGGDLGPALVGVMAPRIVTPRDFAERYSPGEQTLVLAHERTHLERQDSRLNGVCAALQCLCWFNPLVHLAAHLMRIDQELACDEAVVTRFPGARRAYAEVLVKAQLATLPLPLGCYWPSKSEHPLVERIAMLKRKDLGRAHRPVAAAALATLCIGAAFAAWASQPPEVMITVSPVDRIQAVAAAPASFVASMLQRKATSRHSVAFHERALAPTPADGVAEEGSTDQAPSEPALTIAQAQPVSLISQPVVGASPAVEIEAEPAASKATVSSDDPNQMLCQVETVPNSRILRRVCMTRTERMLRRAQWLSFQRFWMDEPYGNPGGYY